MKSLLFGTIRADFVLYDILNELNFYDVDEIKLKSLQVNIGGSVYNTFTHLRDMNCDTMLYSLNTQNDFRLTNKLLNNSNYKNIFDIKDINGLPMSFVFLSSDGNKKMISYDGKRNDLYILKMLLKEINNDALFYTSFYEINKNNSSVICEIMNKAKISVLDLCPIVYQISFDLISKLLRRVDILCGNEIEIRDLLFVLKFNSISELLRNFNIKYIFEKRGKNGARCFFTNNVIEEKSQIQGVAKNTTGCGDCFNAAVIYGVSMGNPIGDILKSAVELSSEYAINNT